MNGASSWTPPKKGRSFELRQDHYTASIILPGFFKEPELVFCPGFELGLPLSTSEPVNRPSNGYRHA